jgi:hypothetical protein
MPTVEECLAHAKWLIEKGRGQEKAVLYLPVVEAQRRKVNKEGRRRVVFVTDEITYSQWHGQRDRWIELCGGNPTLAYPLMCQVLAAISDEAIRGMAEAGTA